jgi:hypothetical protein
MSEAASFLAAFPSIQSAIKVHGTRDGMRIQLDIPESEMGEAAKLLMWRERVLRVQVEPETSGQQGEPRKIKF